MSRARVPVMGSYRKIDDFTVAIQEGATLVRIGRAIFGERTG